MAKRKSGGGRTGAITLGSKRVDQARGGNVGDTSGFLGRVKSGRPANKATGAPIRNGRPVRQSKGVASLRSGGPGGGSFQGMRTGNPSASATRSGIGGVTPIRTGSKSVDQSVSTQGGNFVGRALRSGGGRVRQHRTMLASNVDRANGRKNSNSGRLGTIGVETYGGRGGVTRKH